MDFDQLYRDHFKTVYRLCLVKFKKADFALEITQEAFTRAFVKQGDLRDEKKFLPWVSAIAIYYGYHEARLDLLRYNALPPDDLMTEALYLHFWENPQAEEVEFIRNLLLTFTESDQRLFALKYDDALTNLAISKEMNISLSTVKRHLASLRIRLKEALQKETACW